MIKFFANKKPRYIKKAKPIPNILLLKLIKIITNGRTRIIVASTGILNIKKKAIINIIKPISVKVKLPLTLFVKALNITPIVPV